MAKKKEEDKGTFIRRGRAMFPANERAEAMVMSVPEDKRVLGVFRAVRNIEQLGKWWVLMTWLADHCDAFSTKDRAHRQIKIDLGYFQAFPNVRTGEVHIEVESVAMESMGQREFNDVFDRACDAIVMYYVPGLTSQALKDEVFALIDGPERSSLGKRVA